jgi:hypothetical protein
LRCGFAGHAGAGRRGAKALLVERLPGLETVVELSEEAVEQVTLGVVVPVSVFASAPVVGVGSRRPARPPKS